MCRKKSNKHRALRSRPRDISAGAGVQAGPPRLPVRRQIQTTAYSGPIPPPEQLRQFEALVPGTAERLIRMAEAEALHRRAEEAKVSQCGVDAQRRQQAILQYQAQSVFCSDLVGQGCGVAVCLASVYGVIELGSLGYTKSAIALAALPTAAVLKAFFGARGGRPEPEQ